MIRQKLDILVCDRRFSEILTGSAWALSARVLATGLALISSIIIVRFYGADMMGIVAVINSFLVLASILTLLGTSTSILRLIPEHLAKYSATSAYKVYSKTQYIVIAISLVTGSLFFFEASLIAEQVFSKPHLSFCFALAAVFIIFNSLMILNTQAVRGLRLIRVYALMQIFPHTFNLILLILLGIFLFTKNVPVYALLFSFALTGVIGWAIMEYSFKNRMQPQDLVHSMPIREIFSISMPMFMTSTMTFITGQTGVIMLGMLRSEAEVGYFAIAAKLATLTSFILSSVNSMAAPKFSDLFHSGKMEELFYIAKKSAKLIFWTTIPILLGFVILGRPALSIVFGQEFVIAYPALVLLVLGQFVNSISGSTTYFMNMTGNQNNMRNIMLFAALVNIGLNLLLIPGLGIYGSAIAVMVSLSFWNISALIYIKTKYGKIIGYFPFYCN